MSVLVVSRKCVVSILITILLVCSLQGVSHGQTLKASSDQPLTEATLDRSVVTRTLNGGTYVRFRWDIVDAFPIVSVDFYICLLI